MHPSVIKSAQLPVLASKDRINLPIPPPVNLLLDPTIDPDIAEYRLAYAQQVQRFYPDLDQQTALILGQMAANRSRYGVSYPAYYQKFLDALDQAILSS